MKVALLHSSGAGDSVTTDTLRGAVEGAGHHLAGMFAPDVDMEAVLACSPELLVAAGGDGTVWRAASAVRGRAVPIAILPLGTANNVATSLGVRGRLDDLAAGWHTAERRAVDLGVVRGAKGTSHFLEAVGGGLVSRAIATLSLEKAGSDDPDSRISRALRRYREILRTLEPSPVALMIDGRAVAGEFLLVEVLNMSAVGPNLVLAPGADPCDGQFEVVMAREEHRADLDRYLRDRIDGRDSRLELPTRRARAVEIDGWDELHVDDEVRLGSSIGTICLAVEPGALDVLV